MTRAELPDPVIYIHKVDNFVRSNSDFFFKFMFLENINKINLPFAKDFLEGKDNKW